eukprot:CAMPEP_0197733832 /NCGR_PEP_ID=MMETSP1434-20131217/44109_1 /TAXON_ID=265543 /ORGANISM="Minutocellus polymorphus, Strain CCMP3303" /LENGTH=175 /DNA_ID=CAMNT_0043321227 /DNA_START=94 /DNA_END=621 /DNA_ORIENTATION=+
MPSSSSSHSYYSSAGLALALFAITATCAVAFTAQASSSARSTSSKKLTPLGRLFFGGSGSNADADGMPVLPSDVVKYSQVPKDGFFVKDKIPRGLLKDHTTKKGTWGVIRVTAGKLLYRLEEPAPALEFELTPEGRSGIIEPTRLHRVAPLTDDVEFCVEFHRLPGSGPVDEKRE